MAETDQAGHEGWAGTPSPCFLDQCLPHYQQNASRLIKGSSKLLIIFRHLPRSYRQYHSSSGTLCPSSPSCSHQLHLKPATSQWKRNRTKDYRTSPEPRNTVVHTISAALSGLPRYGENSCRPTHTSWCALTTSLAKPGSRPHLTNGLEPASPLSKSCYVELAQIPKLLTTYEISHSLNWEIKEYTQEEIFCHKAHFPSYLLTKL